LLVGCDQFGVDVLLKVILGSRIGKFVNDLDSSFNNFTILIVLNQYVGKAKPLDCNIDGLVIPAQHLFLDLGNSSLGTG
jgi:hypothetical protein